MMVLEACGAAHHWARVLTGLGHEMKLVAPEAVWPFVQRGKKNDATNAAALCEAARRPGVRFVAAKSAEQQATLALHAARSLLVKQRTMLANATRGLATQFGLTAPQGMDKLAPLAALAEHTPITGAGRHFHGSPRKGVEQRGQGLGQRCPGTPACPAGNRGAGKQDGAHRLGGDDAQGGLRPTGRHPATAQAAA